jgi:enoyl-CoA hydratase/carnithine racemase
MGTEVKSDSSTIKCSMREGVLTIRLNRPDKLNAFTPQMARELVAAFSSASEDDQVGAIVVTGEGTAFCAGMDLSSEGNVFGLDERMKPTLPDLRQRFADPDVVDGVRDTGGRVTLAIYECKKPVIAAINGPAIGIGATMTLAMDVRIASSSARIGFVFGKLGITLEACSSWFLPRLVGMQQALDWAYGAEIVKAEEAQRAGLLKAVFPPEALLAEAHAMATRYSRHRSPIATALMRQMLYRNSALEHPAEAHCVESLAMFYTSTSDGKEGVSAFREKRPAAFTGKASDMPRFYPWWTTTSGASQASAE